MGKKLRIAMYLASDPGKTGGVQEHVYYLSKVLKERGHQVTIFGGAASRRYSDYHRLGYIVPTPLPNGNWISLTLSDIAKEKPSEVVNKGGFDLCHIHEPYTPFVAWELINHLKIPKIVTFHAAWDNGSFAGLLDTIVPMFKSSFSPKIAGAIFISAITKKKWESTCSPKVKKKVILHGVDHDSFYPLARKENGHINLLFLARLVAKKGLSYLLEALSLLVSDFPQIRLVVVGDGEKRPQFESYVRWHHLTKNVFFTGEIKSETRASYYQQADIFCAPYWDEGFGLTVLEAMSCGIPIVGFKNEAFSEWLATYPGKRFLVEPKNVSKLTKALRELIGNTQLRQNLGKWCFTKSKNYSWEKVAQATEKFYYQTLL